MGPLQAIQDALDRAVARGLPGVAAAALLPSGERIEARAGVRGVDNPAPMTADTVFWIASFTKAVTTAAALQLVEASRIDLDEPVERWLPGLAKPKVLAGFDAAASPRLGEAARPITLRHLLTHTSGLAYEFCNADLTRYVAASGSPIEGGAPNIPLMFEPGSAWTYGIGLDWTGMLIEAVTGQTLDAYFAQHIFEPLRMTETSFDLTEAQRGRRATMHARGEGGVLTPTPFEMPPAPYFSMGGGGLHSTARDYLRFLEAILAGGGPILGGESVAAMAQTEAEGAEVGVLPGVNAQLCGHFDPFPGMVKRWGLGFVINPDAGPMGRSAGSLAWAGLGNCYYWADPANGAAGVFLTQILPFGDRQVLEAFGEFERAVYSA
ncbi:MAG: serine hydrolase domain-containing protein [Caulobacterales bacterium]